MKSDIFPKIAAKINERGTMITAIDTTTKKSTKMCAPFCLFFCQDSEAVFEELLQRKTTAKRVLLSKTEI